MVMELAINGAVNFDAKGAIASCHFVIGVFATFPCQELQAF
jgi:hypothetical protein